MPQVTLLHIVRVTSHTLLELNELACAFEKKHGTKMRCVDTEGTITAAVDIGFAQALEEFLIKNGITFQRT